MKISASDSNGQNPKNSRDDSHSSQDNPQPQRHKLLAKAVRACMMLIVFVVMPMFMVYWQQEPIAANTTTRVERKSSDSSRERGFPNTGMGTLPSLLTVTDEGQKRDNLLGEMAQKTNSDSTPDSDPEDGTLNNDISTNQTHKERPSMVWLMSFPNSGTSYTMRMVASASNRAIATNYGVELTVPPGPNTPLYPDENGPEVPIQGPFWDAHGDRPLPQDYILTKTHCGGRCGRCSPKKYILSVEQFIHACTAGRGCAASPSSKKNASTITACEWTEYHYPQPPHNHHIAKLIHLIRNPFDNLVSRYHLARKNAQIRLKDRPDALEEWMGRHPDNAAGFDTWCRELDQEHGSPLMVQNTIGKNASLTCHGEWFKYTQWHTLAVETIQRSDSLPALTIFYEDYEKNWNATAKTILDFLNVAEMSDEVRQFVPGKHYHHHYTPQQRKEARSLVKQIASSDAWELLKRYF